MNTQQNAEFEDLLRAKAAEAKREVRFAGSGFLRMLSADGAYATVKNLLGRPRYSEGFAELVVAGRADLTVEAVVVESEWRRYFSSELIAKAEQRLREAQYQFTPYVEERVDELVAEQAASLSEHEHGSEAKTPENSTAIASPYVSDSGIDALDDLTTHPEGAEPLRTLRLVSGYSRDPKIRNAVLLRANGRCEYCRRPGFEMHNGRRYLEAHHIIGLAQQGPDTMANVIALCAEHHKEAHYGINAQQLEIDFGEILKRLKSK